MLTHQADPHQTAAFLTRCARYYERNPQAIQQGRHVASVLAELSPFYPSDLSAALEAVREEIGAAGVVGALAVWSARHTAKEAADLLRQAAERAAHETH